MPHDLFLLDLDTGHGLLADAARAFRAAHRNRVEMTEADIKFIATIKKTLKAIETELDAMK